MSVHLINFTGTTEEKLDQMAHECLSRGWKPESMVILASRWKITITNEQAIQYMDAARTEIAEGNIPF